MGISRVNTTDTVQYFLCHNSADIYHPIVLEPNNRLESGQPSVESFESEAAFLNRLETLQITL